MAQVLTLRTAHLARHSLLSQLFGQGDHRANHHAGGAGAEIFPVLFGHVGAGDVEMGPVNVLGRNSRRNSAATVAPANPPTSAMLFKSATSHLIHSLYSSTIGRRQQGSPWPAATPATRSAKSSLPKIPETEVPSARRQAPVKVATSTRCVTFSSPSRYRPSLSTRRPSASVLSTWTVLPLRARKMSPGRVERESTRFCAVTNTPVTRRKLFAGDRLQRKQDGGGTGHVGFHLPHLARPA